MPRASASTANPSPAVKLSASSPDVRLNTNSKATPKVVVESPPRKRRRVLVPLPSQDEAMDPEAEARIEAQREEIRAGLARGLRPGLVVPRLRCLESQEEVA